MEKLKVLAIWPPSVPTYFNAGHHLPLWEVSSYLRRKYDGLLKIEIVDAGVLNHSWKEIADVLLDNYDLICVVNEFDNIEAVARIVEYCRAITPRCRIITFGRVSGVIPTFFCKYNIDAIVVDGDFETAVADYVDLLLGTTSIDTIKGLLVRSANDWTSTPAGRYLDPKDWAYPPLKEMPLAAYANISARPGNRFSAIPGRRELTIGVARGCPVGCDYCLVPMYQGLSERRRPVASVIEHIENAAKEIEFDYISMYAPTFTLNQRWTEEFCGAVQPMVVQWKCCTTIRHLSEQLVGNMGRSGCVRISVGLETLDEPARLLLPQAKRISDGQIEALAGWCKSVGIELNCFIMLGMPGHTRDGLRYTFDHLNSLGIKVRPTAYTPYHRLTPSISDGDLSTFFVRQISREMQDSSITAEEFYSMELGAEVPAP
jgi:anaerobic magnesium-protoporphyrin IX monomethyl ester cyclase